MLMVGGRSQGRWKCCDPDGKQIMRVHIYTHTLFSGSSDPWKAVKLVGRKN